MSFTGWIEVFIIGALALVIIGPKDLPKVLFACGRFFQMMKKTAQGFVSEFEQIQNFADVEDMNSKRKKDDAKASSRTSD
jgi:sec-independent protein translocase protein TatB